MGKRFMSLQPAFIQIDQIHPGGDIGPGWIKPVTGFIKDPPFFRILGPAFKNSIIGRIVFFPGSVFTL